jgi:hypothetical protein
MWTIFVSRSLVSIADSLFWVTIIFSLGITIYWVSKGIINHLLEEIPEGEEEEMRAFFPRPPKVVISKWKELFKSKIAKIFRWKKKK